MSNPHCFADPNNSETAAYFIGLLMSDGSVSERGNVTLALQETDRSVVDALNQFLGGMYTVRAVPRDNSDGWNRIPTVRVCFQSEQATTDLARFGVVKTKSVNGHFPNDIKMNPHVWRGMVDGDGSLFFWKNGKRDYPSMTLCGTQEACEQFAEFVRSITSTWSGAVRKTHHHQLMQVKVAGRHAKAIATILYRDATVAIPRKAEIAAQIMDWIPQRTRTDSNRRH